MVGVMQQDTSADTDAKKIGTLKSRRFDSGFLSASFQTRNNNFLGARWPHRCKNVLFFIYVTLFSSFFILPTFFSFMSELPWPINKLFFQAFTIAVRNHANNSYKIMF